MVKQDKLRKDFYTWFKSNRKELTEKLLDSDQYEDKMYMLSCLISDFIIEEFCKENNVNEDYAYENLTLLPFRLWDVL